MPNKSKDNNIISHNLIHMSNYQDDDGSRSLIIFKLKILLLFFFAFYSMRKKQLAVEKVEGIPTVDQGRL